ncbi:hypothetical protein PHLGIDRAFT_412362 [Phlebiopsis gigantea 11061_1 CR5-6]|uniref:Uncharacterized protein n=1 Tax=Phlebiopsis gigantea (strain 11061_1 CR5-6) TaxID=745531 RepID=A0A0C3RZ52_PHLG1|nr:hypothetical protein PHLGIDRAFT_412362 [Phlebiopsis gigantea 11061_1 CR5-6]
MSIIEWIRPPDGDSWTRGDLVIPAPSDANIVAFTQSSAAGDCIQVYWSHADHVVRQRVWFEGKWMDEREVYVNWSAKDLAGFWTGRALDFPASARPDPDVVLGSREYEDEAFEGVSAFPIYAPLVPPSGGLVVIRVQDHTFKVKKNYPQEDFYEGCPVIPLQDNSSDVELLLQVLHDGYALRSYGIREYTVLLDLGSKYQAWGLVKRIMSVLLHEYPDTLEGLHHLSQNHPACDVQMHVCPLTDYYSRLGDSPDESSFTDIRAMLRLLTVATRAGADVLVPSIAVFCCLHDPEAIRAAGAAMDTDPAQISAILNLQTSLTGYARTKIWGAAGPASMRCATPHMCGVAALDAVRVLLFPWWIAALDRRSSGLCAACVSNFWETRAAACRMEGMVWEDIPERLDLGTWQRLRDRAAEMHGEPRESSL